MQYYVKNWSGLTQEKKLAVINSVKERIAWEGKNLEKLYSGQALERAKKRHAV